VFEVVVAAVNRLAVGGTTGRLLFHAEAAERNGRAVVLVGPSGRGKSTLTAALVKAGLGYLTDEVVAVDPTTRRIRPFAKPLNLSDRSLGLIGSDHLTSTSAGSSAKRPVAPQSLGPISAGAEVALIVLIDDDLAPSGSVPTHSSASSARTGAGSHHPETTAAWPTEVTDFVTLLDQVFAETMRVNGALQHLVVLFSGVRVLRIARRDIDSMVAEVLAALPAG
jgi:energy-coupling factor transporter ATP-binding protein EcfA2